MASTGIKTLVMVSKRRSLPIVTNLISDIIIRMHMNVDKCGMDLRRKH
jgi:hypothetical protein